MENIETQKCMRCGRELPATEEYFKYTNKKKVRFKSWCKECEKEYQKAYREQHREKHKEYMKNYYKENKEELYEKEKIRRENNREEYLNYHRNYYKENKEKLDLDAKKYREEHKEEINVYHKNYRKEHEKEKRTYFFNRAAKDRYINEECEFHHITTEEFLSIYEFFDNKCAYSGEELAKGNRSIDHIIPLDMGGTNELWNLVPCHIRYNASKCNKTMEEWYVNSDCFSEERLAKIYEWIELNKGVEK